MDPLHIEHRQPAQNGRTWCGASPTGARITGVESFVYYEGTGPVCRRCVVAVLDKLAVVIKTTEGESACTP
jgi:hypothetical protein